jgi:alkanesulfonate monooxygenase SsuD/methylene tetrahydromethanopterin reductase-like flavin-dependent oxidoreductase (luciferase family)
LGSSGLRARAIFTTAETSHSIPIARREDDMRLGMFMMPVHPPGRTFWSTLEEDSEKSVLADALGFDELWLGEHFSATTEPIPSPMMFFAGLLPRAKNITFGTAVINLPNHHPAIVAAEAAQFDHMSKGRFMLGVGPGGLVSDFELFNTPDVHARNRMVIEAVDFIQRIWSQDPPYDLQGEFWQIRLKDGIIPELGVGFMPKPYQTPGPPISISLASPSSSSARTAALKGWGMISANIIPTYAVASHWDVYCKACGEAGIPASGENWRVARNVLVAPSDSEAHDRVFVEQGSNRYFYTYLRAVLSRVGLLVILKPRPDMPDEQATVDAITRECVTYGSPKAVLDKLVAFRERVGPFGTLLMTGLDWGGPNAAWERESMRLLAQEVMPKFRQHVLARAAE